MSFEGYNEFRCGNGHTDAADVYEKQPTACRECGERWVKKRMIDCTNGRHAGKWREVEYRPRFKDYVVKGYSSGPHSERI